MKIYVQKNESQQGPYTLDEIRTGIESGALLQDDWGWHSNLSDWVRLRTFFEDEPPPPLPTFGPAADRWWGGFKGKKQFPAGYEWLSQPNTLQVCKDHLVSISGVEKRSAVLDIVEKMGLVGGLVAIIRGAKDTLTKRKFELTPIIASKLFEEKQLVWCKKSDAEIWRYLESPWMFIKSSSEQLYCPFNSTAGIIHCCEVLWCTAEYAGEAKGDIDGLGCKFVVVGRDLPEKEVPKLMEAARSRLPD